MDILVVAATEMEIKPFIDQNTGTDILISGVGTPATIYQLTRKLLGNKYKLVIQAGIGGVFESAKMELGTVVIIRQDLFADLGVEENKSFYTLFDMGFASAGESPYTDGWLKNSTTLVDYSPLQQVNGLTVNKISDDPFQIAIIENKYSAAIESMEGAALHYVCIQQAIPFLQLRSISNIVGERNKAHWKMKEAIQNLNNELLLMVNNLKNKI